MERTAPIGLKEVLNVPKTTLFADLKPELEDQVIKVNELLSLTLLTVSKVRASMVVSSDEDDHDIELNNKIKNLTKKISQIMLTNLDLLDDIKDFDGSW